MVDGQPYTPFREILRGLYFTSSLLPYLSMSVPYDYKRPSVHMPRRHSSASWYTHRTNVLGRAHRSSLAFYSDHSILDTVSPTSTTLDRHHPRPSTGKVLLCSRLKMIDHPPSSSNS
jgi:hypothetical protein